MRCFLREKGKTAFSERNPRQRTSSLSRVGKIASRKGVENRGSLISVALALRVIEEIDLVFLRVFLLDFFKKTKEKKDRVRLDIGP